MNVSTVIIGLVVGWFGKAMVDMWNKNKKGLEEKLQTLDNKFLGEAPSLFDRGVSFGVQTVDKLFKTGEFWRTFFWAVYKKDPGRLSKYYDILANSVDWNNYVPSQLPEDLKKDVNEVRKSLAVNIAKNYMVSKTTNSVEVAVDSLASASKPIDEQKPVTKELILKLIEESKIRQEALKK